jgi:hypothetical protein
MPVRVTPAMIVILAVFPVLLPVFCALDALGPFLPDGRIGLDEKSGCAKCQEPDDR